MKQIDHIGIAVNNIEEGLRLYNTILGIEPFHQEVIKKDKVHATFYQIGPTKIELLVPATPDSTIAKFLKRRGPGIHHIAFLVDDIVAEMERMKADGFKPLSDRPYLGALGKLVCFFHPKSTGGTLIELCQKQE